MFKAVLAAVASCLIAGTAWAQSYPTRTIKLIVPFSAGGSTDIIARLTAEQMRKELGQTVVVENVGGAAGALGTMQVMNASPDGYTLAIATVSTMIVYPAAHPKPQYTLDSFVPITNIASMPNVMTVTPSFPAKNLTEFIAVLKASPGKYSYATSGVGSINHMLGESFQAYSGTRLIHIPYKGSGPAMQDVMGGQVDILFDQFPSSKGHIDSGRLKAIGAMSPQKIPGYPGVMTMEEGGLKGFTDEAWYGLLAPAKTPPDVVARLTDAMKKVLANPELRAKLEGVGARPVGNSPQEFAAQVRAEQERMKKLVKERNITLQE
ncbi:MAG: tripartite tricarboxylate transporter substrate binding protein [Burkholderiales bacterium]|nr:tripartite tricarboxylate transporter substrate binding protein [Burkholderiales bacterium]